MSVPGDPFKTTWRMDAKVPSAWRHLGPRNDGATGPPWRLAPWHPKQVPCPHRPPELRRRRRRDLRPPDPGDKGLPDDLGQELGAEMKRS